MTFDVVLLPSYLRPDTLSGKSVAVFDVLRATTTIAAAFAAGIPRIRPFAELDQALAAAAATTPRPLLCGELHTVRAPGFDLGNSPRQFRPEDAGREIFLATTNGTKALEAARGAAKIFTAALINASAAAQAIAAAGRDVVLLCSGTAGEVSMEDLIGAGAVGEGLMRIAGYEPAHDTARIAVQSFKSTRDNLPAFLRETQGGRNNIAVGFVDDVEYAARLDMLDVVGVAEGRNLIITPLHSAEMR